MVKVNELERGLKKTRSSEASRKEDPQLCELDKR